jgi:MOSC domain-containing protein YiiM
MARLLSVNVELPRDVEWKGRTVHTAISKNPVQGRCRVARMNLDGDDQGDLGRPASRHLSRVAVVLRSLDPEQVVPMTSAR